MSAYLELTDTDFAPEGVTLTVPLIIRASSIIDGYCKRAIGVTTRKERIPLTDQQRGHLSYYPVIEVTTLKGKAQYGWTGDNFFGPPAFQEIADLSILDVDKETGSLSCGASMFGAPYTELEVTYSSGWDPIPDDVKVACGIIIGQIQSTPNPNVKAKKDFDFSIEYFGNSMISPEVDLLLSKYRLISMR